MKRQEAKVMLETLRDVFDMVRIVEPFSGQIIDLDSDTPFESENKCYHIWHRDSPCEHCTTQTCCSERKILCKYESLDGVTFHITSKPINIEGNIVAFEIGTIQDEETAASVLHFADQDYEYRNNQDALKHAAIARTLSEGYTSIYYVDINDGSYDEFNSNHLFKRLGLDDSGNDFFADAKEIVSRLVCEDDREYILNIVDKDNLMKELEDGIHASPEVRFNVNGEQTYFKITVTHPSEDKKHIIVAVANVNDEVRERQEAARALQEARDAAEAANKAKTSFLFNMSHDIRTPMNAITGFNAMAIKHIDNREKVKECLEKVELSSQHLLSIINDILDIARIESGKAEIELQPVQLSEAATELFEIVQQSVKDKELTFTHDFSQIKHDYIMVDHLRVSRVIMNIASNAVKYTENGGTISYTIKETESSGPDRAAFDFIMADTGIGMSDEFLKRIFEAFSRDESSRISGIQGTGLGMAITKELVDLMGGTIDIKSKQGQGTTVTVHLEFDLGEEIKWVTQDEETVDDSVLKNMKVLLVEDNELNKEIAVDILEEYGVIVETATDGKESVEIVKKYIEMDQQDYLDLILMDIQMPVMNGYDATVAIRELPWKDGYRIPIIAMTANAFAEDKAKGLECGMDGHLSKPINIKEMVKMLIATVEDRGR